MQAGFRGRLGWTMYDWAAQPFFTIVITFVFGPYFVSQVVGDPVKGQAMWGYTQTFAGLALALMAPFAGALADATGPRKPWVLGFSAICIAASTALWLATPGANDTMLALIIVCIVIGTIGAEFSIVFNNAMLPSLAPAGRIGGLSGYGWAMGYVGGLISLAIILIATGQMPGIPGPGFADPATPFRISGPFSGLWFLLFLIPFMLWTPDAPRLVEDRTKAVHRAVRGLGNTLKTLPRRPNILRFLIARMIYYDGLNAIFLFGGVYVQGQFGWGLTELGLFGIVALVAGIPGSLLGGRLDDLLGSRTTLLISVSGLFLITLGLISVGDGKVFFFMPMDFPTPGDGLFASPAEQIVMLLTALLGLFAGPAQSSSRAMVARIAPPDRIGQYFGLFSLSGKITAFLAPLSIGLVTDISQSSRIGVSVILIFLLLGLILLTGVREQPDAET